MVTTFLEGNLEISIDIENVHYQETAFLIVFPIETNVYMSKSI